MGSDAKSNTTQEIRTSLNKLLTRIVGAALSQPERVALSDLIVDCYTNHHISRAEYHSVMASL